MILSIVGVVVLIISFYYVLWPILSDTGVGTTTKFLDLIYPVSDLILIFIAMYVFSIYGEGLMSKAWLLLTGGFVFSGIADTYFSYLTWMELYETNYFAVDLLWAVSYLLFYVGTYYYYLARKEGEI